jgi:hypothetical protein
MQCLVAQLVELAAVNRTAVGICFADANANESHRGSQSLGYGLVVKLSADNGAIASSILATPTNLALWCTGNILRFERKESGSIPDEAVGGIVMRSR